MRIRTISILAATAALVAACGPQPGSTEWCKGVVNGEIEPTAAEKDANSDKCKAALMSSP